MPQRPTNRPQGRPSNGHSQPVRRTAQQGKPAAPKTSVTFIYDFFISYSFTDRDSATLLCDELERRGYKCFVAHRDIPKGAAFAQMIPWAVEKSRVMITLLTKNFDASAHTSREVSLATESAMPVLTVKMEDCELTGLKKYYLRDINWIDASEGVEKSCDEIEATFKRLAEKYPTRISTAAPRKTAKIYKKKLTSTWINIAVFAIMAVIIIILFKRLNKTESQMANVSEQLALIENANAKSANEGLQEFVAEVEPVHAADIAKDTAHVDKDKVRYNELILEIKSGKMDFSDKNTIGKNIKKLEELVDIIERKPDIIDNEAGDSLRTTAEKGAKASTTELQKAKLEFILGKLYYYNIGTKDQTYRKDTDKHLKAAYEKIPEAGLYLALNQIRNVNYVKGEVIKIFSTKIVELHYDRESLNKNIRDDVDYYYKRSAVLCRQFNIKPPETADSTYAKETTPYRESLETKYKTQTNDLSKKK